MNLSLSLSPLGSWLNAGGLAAKLADFIPLALGAVFLIGLVVIGSSLIRRPADGTGWHKADQDQDQQPEPYSLADQVRDERSRDLNSFRRGGLSRRR